MRFTTKELSVIGYITTIAAREYIRNRLVRAHIKWKGDVIKPCFYRPQYAHSESNMILRIDIVDISRDSYDTHREVNHVTSVELYCTDEINRMGKAGASIEFFNVEALDAAIKAANDRANTILDMLSANKMLNADLDS